eukprot:COSAG01_NODE_32475_length_580_cov_2.020790_2_plen_37_part_01
MGHYIRDDGLVEACEAQTGCGDSDRDAACVGSGGDKL